jgi:hypothetical protein
MDGGLPEDTAIMSQAASFSALLDRIIQRGGLSRNEGHPLYAYRTTPDELRALREGLQNRLAWTSSLDTFGAAAFCLFAAEWFCETYTEGPWSWRAVLDATGFTGTYTALYDIVLRGLRYWNRPVLVAGSDREFLITLGCEGGLPRELLRNDKGGRLQRFLRDLLAARESYRRPARELVPKVADILPPTLRQEVVFGLATQLIEQVAWLRQQSGTAAEPIAYLDRELPTWRDLVPLRLDDLAAGQLLAGLLHAPRAPAVDFIEVQTRLWLEGAPRLERVARFPATMSVAAFAGQLGLERGTLPSRVYLHLMTAEGASLPVATATLAGAGDEVDVVQIGSPAVREPKALLGRLLLVATAGSRDLAYVQPPGGEGLDMLPWAFRALPQGGAHHLVAVGSCRTGADELLLALPEGGEIMAEPGAILEEITALEAVSRRVMRLRGTAYWGSEGERCSIRTGDAAEAERFALRGALRRLGFEGAEVWTGAPRWALLRGDGSTADLGAAYVQEWRPARGAGLWRPLGQDCCGDVAIRVRRGGETLARTVVTVLPRGLELRVHPSAEAKRGRLEIAGLGRGRVGVTCPTTVTWTAERAGATTSIRFESAGKPPATVDLRLELESGGEARVRAPFPSKTRYFAGGDGELLPDGYVATLNRLSWIRARAIVEGLADGFVIDACVEGDWTTLGRLRRVSETCFEIGLDALRDSLSLLLASSFDLDATVRLRIYPERGLLGPPHPELLVGRHDVHLSRTRGGEGLPIDLHLEPPSLRALGSSGLDGIRLEARPLEDPSAAPIELARAGERWLFDETSVAAGPWLVLGYQGPALRVRPLLLTASGAPGAPPSEKVTTDFDRAVRIFDKHARIEALAALAASMASDLDHPEWRRAREYLSTLGRLPSTTFHRSRAKLTSRFVDPDFARQ